MLVGLDPQSLGVLLVGFAEEPVGLFPALRLRLAGEGIPPVVEGLVLVGLDPQSLGVLLVGFAEEPVGLFPALRLRLAGKGSPPVVEGLVPNSVYFSRLSIPGDRGGIRSVKRRTFLACVISGIAPVPVLKKCQI